MIAEQDNKPILDKKAVAVVVAIIVTVTTFTALVVLMAAQEDKPTGYGAPSATYSRSLIADGEQINIVSIQRMIVWDHIKVQLSDGTNFAEWNTATSDLDGAREVTMNYGSDSLGTLIVFLNATDISGDGVVSAGDYFRVTTGGTAFSSGTTYAAVLINTDTDEKIGTGVAFNG